MSITKKVVLDKVEFVGDYSVLQVRERTDVVETIDGVENVISSSYHRSVYNPDQLNPRLLGTDEDGNEYRVEPLPENLVPYVTGVWTDELVQSYTNDILANEAETLAAAQELEAAEQTE